MRFNVEIFSFKGFLVGDQEERSKCDSDKALLIGTIARFIHHLYIFSKNREGNSVISITLYSRFNSSPVIIVLFVVLFLSLLLLLLLLHHHFLLLLLLLLWSPPCASTCFQIITFATNSIISLPKKLDSIIARENYTQFILMIIDHLVYHNLSKGTHPAPLSLKYLVEVVDSGNNSPSIMVLK